MPSELHAAMRTLERMEERLAHGWCQGEYARTADGCPTWAGSADAAQHCLMGAYYAACFPLPSVTHAAPARRAVLTYLMEALRSQERKNPRGGWRALSVYNDTLGRTQEEVLALVRYARALVQTAIARDLGEL